MLCMIFLASIFFSPITPFTTTVTSTSTKITTTTSTTTSISSTTITTSITHRPYAASTTHSGFELAVYVSVVEPRIGDEVEIKIVLSNMDHLNATRVCCGDTKISILDEEGEAVYGLLIWHSCLTGPLTRWRIEPRGQISHAQTLKVQTQPPYAEIQIGKHYLTVSDCFTDLNTGNGVRISLELMEVSLKGS